MKIIDPKVAAWLARVAEALAEVGDCNPGYGEFYVSDVTVGFDGDDTEYRLRPSDGGGSFEIVLVDRP